MNLEKNTEKNTEKFTEKNTEKFFCIFSVNFSVFFPIFLDGHNYGHKFFKCKSYPNSSEQENYRQTHRLHKKVNTPFLIYNCAILSFHYYLCVTLFNLTTWIDSTFMFRYVVFSNFNIYYVLNIKTIFDIGSICSISQRYLDIFFKHSQIVRRIITMITEHQNQEIEKCKWIYVNWCRQQLMWKKTDVY